MIDLSGAAGIVHVAHESPTSLTPATDPDTALNIASADILGVLKAAAAVPSVKSFVLTSSSNCSGKEKEGDTERYALDKFADHLIPLSRSLPDSEPIKPLVICEYQCSNVRQLVAEERECLSLDGAMKVHAELEAWKYWREEKVKVMPMCHGTHAHAACYHSPHSHSTSFSPFTSRARCSILRLATTRRTPG